MISSVLCPAMNMQEPHTKPGILAIFENNTKETL